RRGARGGGTPRGRPAAAPRPGPPPGGRPHLVGRAPPVITGRSRRGSGARPSPMRRLGASPRAPASRPFSTARGGGAAIRFPPPFPATSSPPRYHRNVAQRIRHTRVRSGIRLDSEGQFWHDGQRVTHPGILRAWHRGLERAPDGRYLIRFGHDWAYVRVDDAPFFVLRATPEEKDIRLRLSNETEDILQGPTLGLSPDGVLYCKVKGEHVAKFTRQAQADL